MRGVLQDRDQLMLTMSGSATAWQRLPVPGRYGDDIIKVMATARANGKAA